MWIIIEITFLEEIDIKRYMKCENAELAIRMVKQFSCKFYPFFPLELNDCKVVSNCIRSSSKFCVSLPDQTTRYNPIAVGTSINWHECWKLVWSHTHYYQRIFTGTFHSSQRRLVSWSRYATHGEKGQFIHRYVWFQRHTCVLSTIRPFSNRNTCLWGWTLI